MLVNPTSSDAYMYPFTPRHHRQSDGLQRLRLSFLQFNLLANSSGMSPGKFFLPIIPIYLQKRINRAVFLNNQAGGAPLNKHAQTIIRSTLESLPDQQRSDFNCTVLPFQVCEIHRQSIPGCLIRHCQTANPACFIVMAIASTSTFITALHSFIKEEVSLVSH